MQLITTFFVYHIVLIKINRYYVSFLKFITGTGHIYNELLRIISTDTLEAPMHENIF